MLKIKLFDSKKTSLKNVKIDLMETHPDQQGREHTLPCSYSSSTQIPAAHTHSNLPHSNVCLKTDQSDLGESILYNTVQEVSFSQGVYFLC